MRRHRILWILFLLLAISATMAAQRGQRRGGRSGFDLFGFGSDRYGNLPYDGKFIVARIQYARYGGWAYDYPAMERHFTTLLDVLTSIEPHVDGSNVHRLDDPELLKFPVAYLSEPGYWFPSESESEGLRQYLAKGGFLIVDDFHYANEWYVFEQAMRSVLPTARIDRLDRSHPVFNSFFAIDSLDLPYPSNPSLIGEFYGIHEDNDPGKRLQVVINYNMDIGDYMEWSDQSVYEFASTNEAYKFGINYVIYGLTH
jgi:hypothetical protein